MPGNAFISKETGETSAEPVWMDVNALCGGLGGAVGGTSKLNLFLNSFSRLSRMRAPGLTLESLRP